MYTQKLDDGLRCVYDKMSRIDLRVTYTQKDLMMKAAAMTGMKLSDWIRQVCLSAARQQFRSGK